MKRPRFASVRQPRGCHYAITAGSILIATVADGDQVRGDRDTVRDFHVQECFEGFQVGGFGNIQALQQVL